MRTSTAFRRHGVWALLACSLVALTAPAPATAGRPLRLTFETVGGGPPEIDIVDGMVVFKVTPVQSVSGDLVGLLTERITQVYPVGREEESLPITTLWTLETTDGTIEGAYSGIFNHLPDGNHLILQHGNVLSVTGAYARLYKANVTYRAVLAADHQDIAGSLTIDPRR